MLHTQLLRDLWNHRWVHSSLFPPRLQHTFHSIPFRPNQRYSVLEKPALFLVAGTGGRSPISANKRVDIDEVEEMVAAVQVQWFPESGGLIPTE